VQILSRRGFLLKKKEKKIRGERKRENTIKERDSNKSEVIEPWGERRERGKRTMNKVEHRQK